MTETPEPDREPPWWSVGKTRETGDDTEQPAESPLPLGWHITVTPPAPPPPAPTVDPRAQERRTRARRWILTHGAAAGTGWAFGLGPSLAAWLETLGPGAPAAGLCMAGFGWFGAEFVEYRYLRVLPPRLRPPARWALRIPMSTALLATALHTPNALI